MGLILPAGPSWAYCSDNLPSTPSASAPGTAVTASGTPNADGTAVTLLSALAHDCEYLVVSILGNSAVANNRSSLLDILVDPAGGTSFSAFIDDLLAGYASIIAATLGIGPAYQYHFPVWIKAGTTIGAQMRSAGASSVNRVVVHAFGGNKNPASWACGQKVTTVGTMSAATSRGQAHTPGNSGAFSSWTSLGSTLGSAALAWQTAAQGEGTNDMANVAYNFEFGYDSTRIGPRKYHVTGTSEAVAHWPSGVAFNQIASGTQLQVRGTCSGTAESVDVAAYVVS